MGSSSDLQLVRGINGYCIGISTNLHGVWKDRLTGTGTDAIIPPLCSECIYTAYLRCDGCSSQRGVVSSTSNVYSFFSGFEHEGLGALSKAFSIASCSTFQLRGAPRLLCEGT